MPVLFGTDMPWQQCFSFPLGVETLNVNNWGVIRSHFGGEKNVIHTFKRKKARKKKHINIGRKII